MTSSLSRANVSAAQYYLALCEPIASSGQKSSSSSGVMQPPEWAMRSAVDKSNVKLIAPQCRLILPAAAQVAGLDPLFSYHPSETLAEVV